ncbi:MAG: hypothetical protein MOIL_00390 [Candidatus Methanolliviera sp. GoM_oil]|nr:MAG: hypothetical protein MOIL_00390 [Candidatus Methanolliviera sp. GoM_oil]
MLEKIERCEDLLCRCTVAIFSSSLSEILFKIGFKNIKEAVFKRDKKYMKNILKRCDIIISGHKDERFLCEMASDLGIPLITGKVITVILPDGYDYDDLDLSRFEGLKFDPYSHLIIRYLQAFEAFKVLTGAERPTFAPMAIKINEEIEMIDLIKSQS